MSEMRAIVVEEGVREIGDGWFNYLNEVREISLPTTLWRIGKSAFASCERLKEVCIPEGGRGVQPPLYILLPTVSPVSHLSLRITPYGTRFPI